ncbi:hypothetical protein E4656_12515 [Natronospirillum operosum]|uniref:Uncharacterized protein n=1 Tax=Natronospirillum operosum TaxID=2759953 RepID=A0A4Z0W871_9GAMM|nr:hypothetical protein [Natronospirillum operosum]TGG92937.1 hypothetical protein E4656_12515 [Natronospirillum operosum]
MKHTRLKFVVFLIVLTLVIIGLLFLEQIRDHPSYAPMFNNMIGLPLLWGLFRYSRQDTRSLLAASHSNQ